MTEIDRIEDLSDDDPIRMTVQIIPMAKDALIRGAAVSHHSRTDFVNRAIQAYAFLEEEKAKGYSLMLVHPDGEAQHVRFL